MLSFTNDILSSCFMGIASLLLFFLVLFLSGVAILCIDYIFGHNQQLSVIVMDKICSPIPEKFVLLVKADTGEIFLHEVKPDIYVSIKKHERINIIVRIGFSNSRF